MFENIIGQSDVLNDFKRDIASGTLPGSMLFYGPSYSGKYTTALELARVLTCEQGTADWNCTCRSCEFHRRLIHPNILLLGPRYFSEEIAACAEVVLRLDKDSTRYLFIRSVRKLTRRFDPALWDGNDAKLKRVQGFLSDIEERLDFFLPGTEHSDHAVAEGSIKKIVDLCGQVLKEANLDGISIDRIRKANLWAQTTGTSRKVIIIENADQMLDGARNAMLKTLEEPAPDVYFILLTERRNAVIPTIASRLRPYRFLPRDAETSSQVLERIFRETSGRYAGVREYFLAWGVNLEVLRSRAVEFVQEVLEEGYSYEKMRPLFDALQKEGSFPLFLEELSRHIRALGENNAGSPSQSCREYWMGLIREARYRHETLNQGAALSAENMFYAMKESLSCAAS